MSIPPDVLCRFRQKRVGGVQSFVQRFRCRDVSFLTDAAARAFCSLLSVLYTSLPERKSKGNTSNKKFSTQRPES